MSTFRPYRLSKRLPFQTIRKIIRLRSAVSVIVALCIYTTFSTYLFSPRTIEICQEEGSCALLSTEGNDPLRSSLEQAIRTANKSIVLIIYSLSDIKIINALRSAAARGVDVCVIHDPIETPDASSALGHKVKCYPRREKGLMHNKLLAIDHTIAWIGSANMSTRSLQEQGNMVIALRSYAIAKAIEELGAAIIKKLAYTSPPLEVCFPQGKITVFFHPFHGDLALQNLIKRIDKASSRIFVAMFTFTHPELLRALCKAKQRGVDVRVIFDQQSSQETSRQAYLRCKREGISTWYRIKSGLLHHKTAVIDDTLVAGSCNWTKAGFVSNHEAMVFIEPLSPSQQVWISRWWDKVEHFSSKNRGFTHVDPSKSSTIP